MTLDIRVAVIDCPINFDIPFFECLECEFNGGMKKDGHNMIIKCNWSQFS